MLNVKNRGAIRTLGFRSMRAARTRNAIAILAIALTTLLFTSLFTIAASLNYSFQQENFRMAGGDAHGTFKQLSLEQAEALRDDPLIVDSWTRLFLGMPSDPPFNKSHVEVSYIEPNGASHYFCTPVEGALPAEGTDQMATDTHVLALLGVEPEIGAQVTLPFYIDCDTAHPQLVTRTFTLSGWWDYDSAVVANNVLLPRSAAEEIAALSHGGQTMTGQWGLDVMFKSSIGIRDNLSAVLANHGYQCDDIGADNYLRIGVNWGYTGDKLTENLDPALLLTIAALLLLIVFTGYLIIYDVFQISVTNDIRFYGLLKTIGTTGRQIKRIVRQQALVLSAAGIPLGLLLGFLIGNKLTPVIMAISNYDRVYISFSPLIFVGAALFSLVTVFLSCAKPGRLAARVSPIEALRYTEGGGTKRRTRKSGGHGASLFAMARANLGRSRGKTAVTVLSLSLSVVLLTLTYTFVIGFDMDKYLAASVTTDFIVGHANQFVAGSGGFSSEDQAVPEEIISAIEAQGGVTGGGRIYGQEHAVQQLMPVDFYRQEYSSHFGDAIAEESMQDREKSPDGLLIGSAQLYGMEDFPLDQLRVLEGDLAPLSDPSRNAIAAAYYADDYNGIMWETNWAKVGDTVTLRYVSQWGYRDPDTGAELDPDEVDAIYDQGGSFQAYAKEYEEKEYTVCALVHIPNALSYRYSTIGASEFVLGAERFRADTGMDSVMVYAFNTTEEACPAMEEFLQEYTAVNQPIYDYESKATYAAEFEGLRSMFLIVGGALSFIVGLVGVLNFFNAILTGIITRRREFAMLQSIGMTGSQLERMLICEGLLYALGAVALSLALTLALAPLVSSTVGSLFWFFSYRFTAAPIALVAPVFALLGALLPLLSYRRAARQSIVERLRDVE